MGIVILPAVVEMEVPYSDLTVILILEVLCFPVPFRFFLEDVIPSVDTVKRFVELVLLELAILPVLFCNLVLVSHLYVQDSCEQVSVAACCSCCLHNCIILEIVNFGFDTVTAGNVAVHVLDQLDLFWIKVETPFHGRGIYLVPFVLRQEPVLMTETPEYNLVFLVALEHGPFIVLQEL